MISALFRNIRVIDPATGSDTVRDLAIRDGRILPEGAPVEGLPVIRGDNRVAAPGFWDVHVHFRDPGNPAAETRKSGCRAAAAGGFTHVVTMPNTVPAGDNEGWIREQIEDPGLDARILPSACVTRGRAGQAVTDIEALARAGASSFTDDGNMVVDDGLMREAMTRAAKLGLPVMDHAILPSIAGKGVVRTSPVAERYPLPIFPSEAEIRAVERDIRLCEETGCRVDIQHLSSGVSVEAIRQARARGVPVTGEASPHHMALAAEDIPGDDGNYRMNPPLGNRSDMEAIRQGVLDGTLTLFATDHAPHTVESKSQGFLKAPFGIIGLETAVGVTYRVMVEECGLSLLRWVQGWTTGPAAVLGLPAPSLKAGSVADLVILDLRDEWTVDPSRFRSLSRNTPFSGWKLRARAVATVCVGRRTYLDETAGITL